MKITENMSSKRQSKRLNRNLHAPYDKQNVNTWSSDQIRDKLKEWDIYVPSTCSKAMLKSLYAENLSHRSNPRNDKGHVSGKALLVPSEDTIMDQNSDHGSGDNALNIMPTAKDQQANQEFLRSSDNTALLMKSINDLVTLSGNKKDNENSSKLTLEKFGGQITSQQISSPEAGYYGIHPE